MNRYAFAVLALAAGCAKAKQGDNPDAPPNQQADASVPADALCGIMCDHDHDGVVDGNDQCPDTPQGEKVNQKGCSDSQLTPKLNPNFPPYGLAWTTTGDAGRAGGLTWTYAGITRGDLFHIWWIICDDPAEPCGVSLDGAIDQAGEHFVFDATSSDLANGKIVYANTTNIITVNGTTPLSGRVTITIVDGNDAAIPVFDTASMGVTARDGTHGAEIKGLSFRAVIQIEVADSSQVWTPYLDYYDAAQTPDLGTDAGGNAVVSFGGSFYDK
ncbi:MAG TPA: hypothetical protein VL463_10875 [Kofleriaceae bacterium]|nr:hypothetical protein [Kofleriaceae bacterium]